MRLGAELCSCTRRTLGNAPKSVSVDSFFFASMEGIMIKRILLVAFVLGIVQWVSCVGARAQVVGCVGFVYCGAYSFDATCLPAPPSLAFNCVGIPFAFEQVCQIPLSQCPPAAASQENQCPCTVSPGGGSSNGPSPSSPSHSTSPIGGSNRTAADWAERPTSRFRDACP